MKRSKELAVCGMLTALAIILSIVERMFPLDAIIPIPGVKLGLANVVTLFALTRLGLRDSLAVVVVRVTLASLLMGSVTAFISAIMLHAFFMEMPSLMPGILRISISRTRVPILLT